MNLGEKVRREVDVRGLRPADAGLSGNGIQLAWQEDCGLGFATGLGIYLKSMGTCPECSGTIVLI